MVEGLPDITGTFTAGYSGTVSWSSGAFWHIRYEAGYDRMDGGATFGLTRFAANRSSSIYGTSTTVTPLSRGTRYIIKY